MDFFTQCGQYSCNITDYVSAFSGVFAILAVLFGVYKFVNEQKVATQTRRDELNWKKIEASQLILKRMRADPNVRHAMGMIDSASDHYFLPGAKKSTEITRQQVDHALRIECDGTGEIRIEKVEKFIRDCFDDLLTNMGEIDVMIDHGHANKDLFIPFIGYYCGKAVRNKPLENYAKAFGFQSSWRAIKILSNLNEQHS